MFIRTACSNFIAETPPMLPSAESAARATYYLCESRARLGIPAFTDRVDYAYQEITFELRQPGTQSVIGYRSAMGGLGCPLVGFFFSELNGQ
jgi:hypothetical protein